MTKMTKSDASRIASTTSKQNGGQTPKDSFAARAQSTADSNKPNWPSKHPDEKSGGNRTNNPPSPKKR